jgi:hypothetical protein
MVKQPVKLPAGKGILNTGARRRWMINTRPRPLYPQQGDPVPPVQEAGWISRPVQAGAENLAPPAFDPRTVQPVARRYMYIKAVVNNVMFQFHIRHDFYK